MCDGIDGYWWCIFDELVVRTIEVGFDDGLWVSLVESVV